MACRKTSGAFELKQLDNAIRIMVTSFDTQPQHMHVYLYSLTPGGGKTSVPVPGTPLQVTPSGFNVATVTNLPVGFYEIDVTLSDDELKPTADIRDGLNTTDPGYIRYFLSPDNFVKQIV